MPRRGAFAGKKPNGGESSAEAKTKSRGKKQNKKKERRSRAELEKAEAENLTALRVSTADEPVWEIADDAEACGEEVAGRAVEEEAARGVPRIVRVEVLVADDGEPSRSSANDEEEKSVRELLRTLESVDSRMRQPRDADYELVEFSRASKSVAPVAEEAAEKRGEEEGVAAETPRKVLYSYNGVPVGESDGKQSILLRDIDDGILLVNNIRDRYPCRQLDVITEESSDVSEASSIKSDKRKKEQEVVYRALPDKSERIFDGRGKTFDLQIQPVVKETVKIVPLQRKTAGDSTRVRIQTVVVEKIHPSSIVKIELPERESEDEGADATSWDDESDAGRADPASTLSAKDVLNNSAADIRFIDEVASERSWSSGGTNRNPEEGIEADVESELDSRRETLFFEDDDGDPFDAERSGTIKRSPYKGKPEADASRKKSEAKSSPTASGRDSSGSCASGGTVKSRDEGIKALERICAEEAAADANVIDLGCISAEDRLLEDYLLESPYKNRDVAEQTDRVERRVDVKKLAKALEKDMDKILKSKLKVIEFFDDPVLSEASWSRILRNRSRKRSDGDEDEASVGGNSNFSFVKFEHRSNSGSYENVSGSRESGNPESENLYESVQSPEALAAMAEKKILSLPYGRFLLTKIGLGKCCDCDDERDTYTKIDDGVESAASPRSRATSSSETKPRCLPWANPSPKKSARDESRPRYVEFECAQHSSAEKWYGMPTSNPALFLGLSPSQKRAYEEKHKRFLSDEQEAANLLDLHKKFLERRRHCEANPRVGSEGPAYAEITPKREPRGEDSCSLLTILRREKTAEEQEQDEAQIALSSLNEIVKSFEESAPTSPPPPPPPPPPPRRVPKNGEDATATAPRRKNSTHMTEDEMFKQKMYEEYMTKVAERLERRSQKVIKMSQIESADDVGRLPDLENEFIGRVRQRMDKLGLKDEVQEEEEEEDPLEREFERLFEAPQRRQQSGSSRLLLDAASDLTGLPQHLRELLQDDFSVDLDDDDDGSAMISPTFKATAPRPGIWSPVRAAAEDKADAKEESEDRKKLEDEPIPPVWTPKSAQASPVLERKEFRPVNFESPTLPRKKYIQEERSESVPPPWQQQQQQSVELAKTPSSPALSLPKAPNPTVTLLQKAREGHLPKGAHYLDSGMSESLADDGSVLVTREKTRSTAEESKKAESAPRKVPGIGPITKEGIPLVLRSEVTDENKEKWYKRMYDSLHKAGKDEDFVTVKYRTSPSRKGLYGYQPVPSSGYQSEPETIIYDADRYRSSTLDRRRSERSKEGDYISVTLPRSRASTPRYGAEQYRNQPGRIEDYEPGHSSISESEARQWWDEVLEIFDRWLDRSPDRNLVTEAILRRRQEERSQPIRLKAQSPKSFMTYALKESGYISDPQHVFKRREDDFQTQLSPQEQKEAYRVIQKGGEVPLRGLRKPAPERPKEDRNAQIEYFPLSPTLTRIRVHKQNITPVSQFPILQFPVSWRQGAANYPAGLPIGVCSSFSQVQIFPAIPATATAAQGPDARAVPEDGKNPARKFSVQLQNIAQPKEHVRIAPRPRSCPKKSPIYANLPVCRTAVTEEESPPSSPEKRTASEEGAGKSGSDDGGRVRGGGREFAEVATSRARTFSELKRVAPSLVSSKSFTATESGFSGANGKRTSPAAKSKAATPRKTSAKSSSTDIARGKVAGKRASKPERKVPLSESLRRERRPLSGKRSRNGDDGKRSAKKEEAERSPVGTNDADERPGSAEQEEIMNSNFGYRHKVETNVTEAFRSRSFSPDVRRKVPKPAEAVVQPPTPPKRKQSKNAGSTLRMWSKMMVTYPYHKSRLDVYDSNVKFLRDKLRRKLDGDADDDDDDVVENESRFGDGDDVETVRTVRKDKDGSMSIKTNRYVNVARAASSRSPATPLRYAYNEHGRRVLSEPSGSGRRRFEAATPSKASDKANGKQKSDTVVRSSTTYSVRRPVAQEDKRKSVKVTVAVSSKGKELMRKSASMSSTAKKPVPASSPCPSVGSYRSGLSSAKSPSERGSSASSLSLSPQNRFVSPSSSLGRASSPSRSVSPASVAVVPAKRESASPPLTITFDGARGKKAAPKKAATKSPGEKAPVSKIPTATRGGDAKRRAKKGEKTENGGKTRKSAAGRSAVPKKKEPERHSEDAKNEVSEHTNLVRTDSFFQNLFLRGPPDKKPLVRLDRTSSVLERARQYQRNIDAAHKAEPQLSLVTYYLSQKRPVSLSKFRYLDRETSYSRSPSPYRNRSPKLRHFDSLSRFGDEDFGSGRATPTTAAKERSSSEPPSNRSPVTSPSPAERMPVKPASRLSASETSSLRTSPNSSRSPSCRRIRIYKPECPARKAPRARSAGEAEEAKPKAPSAGSLARSTSSLNLSNLSDHAEYQAYILELVHSKEKCQRFRDLHKFYSSLERMGELERTTSVTDLRPRLKNEEIIDFDRWKQVRTKERAEEELRSLVGKLVKVQKEKDLLFRTADVEAMRWKGDRGLRLKERSVEDLKERFDKTAEDVADVDNFKKCIESGKDVYKPFWRGNSIANVASTLNATTASHRGRPVTRDELRRIRAAEERLAKKFGLKSFDSRAWSSLSAAQVDALKSQLSEIYGQEARKKEAEAEESESYEITVPEDSSLKAPGEKGLYVRCNSALAKEDVYASKKEEAAAAAKKSGSIGALPSWKCEPEEEEKKKKKKSILELPWKEEEVPSKAKAASKPLSENEKKRLSMTLSKEVLEKLTKTSVKTHLLPRETLGALVVASSGPSRQSTEVAPEVSSPRTCYSLETSEDGKSKNNFLLVLTPTDEGNKDVEKVVEEWANGTSDNTERTPSITELESASASSETSVKTVIRNPVDVLKRVEYFEELRQSAEESRAEEEEEERPRAAPRYGGLAPSRSLENVGEFFGEQRRYAVATREESRPSCGLGSSDSLFSARSRSVSPDPTKYYRAYLRMVKCGAVRKLRNKFESWEDLLALSSDRDPWLPPKRYASDPELARDLLRRYGTDPKKVTVRGQEVGDVRWLRTKYETKGRGHVQRSPFVLADRLMPRINVISKTAELQMSRRRSPDGTSDRYAPYAGEVDKLRRKFEKLHAAERLSLLGQMYTSTPDVNELRDAAPYLECSWVAHRHPQVSKTSSTPELRVRRADSARKPRLEPRPRSSSPARPRRPPSILKCPPRAADAFADQKYDPSVHRPVCRYQPEVDHRPARGAAETPRWRQWTKPSVTFKEPVGLTREPKARDSTPGTPDSSRKYVESEVTIHYKSPVRSEAKAALSEDELARRQAESMKRIYKEERRRKYLQELQDMNSRRHADNFTPSQKSPIPLNRYDDFPEEHRVPRGRDHSAEPVLVARGLYDFVGRRPRELAFRRGDVIFILRQLDKNWCEGELNGAVGLFPISYVEIIPYGEYNPKFGRARAKYDFVPQTSLELSARKGEMITLVRKIDENWFEGRIGDRTGIIPASYCQVLSMPVVRLPSRAERAASTKPVAAPAAHSLIHNGSAVSSKHYYTPCYGGRSSPGRSATSPAVREAHATIDQLIDEALYHLEEDIDSRRGHSKTPAPPLNLRVNPRPEPALYQVVFNHVPNNDDELELVQGETVLVLEKCGDGWYIGSKSGGGKLGIFPGTHVRRIAPEFV